MEKRINLNLLEGMFCCSLLPHLGFLFATFTIVMSYLGKYPIRSITWIIYIASVLFLIIFIILFSLFDRKHSNVIILKPEEICFSEKKNCEVFPCRQIVRISYTKCSMAMLLFPFIMYLNGRGVCILKFENGKRKTFYLFSRDYQKLIFHINKYTNEVDSVK